MRNAEENNLRLSSVQSIDRFVQGKFPSKLDVKGVQSICALSNDEWSKDTNNYVKIKFKTKIQEKSKLGVTLRDKINIRI